MKNIVIIGGGAAGLMAAVSAGKHGAHSITVIERNTRPARKMMITGKGRCNLTNNCSVDTLIKNTVTNGKFMFSAFNGLNSADVMSFFKECGVALKTERGNRVFPESDKAVTVVDALVREAQKYAEIVCDRATSLIITDGSVKAVKCESGKIYPANAVIIATGGASYPLTGSTGDGYMLSRQAGHCIKEIRPSLIGINCHEGFCSKLAGLSLKNVTLSLFENGRKKPLYSELGEMLFTHTGISGPLALTASAYIKNTENKNYTVKIDLKPALSFDTLDRRVLKDFSENINCDFINSLSALLPKSLIPVVVALSGIEPRKKVNQISAEERAALVNVLKGLSLNVTSLGDIEEAIVTSGGVDVKQISPATMESKLVDGLYFAGEVMDVDALTGGFNLQIAFSSGYSAGYAAAEKLRGE